MSGVSVLFSMHSCFNNVNWFTLLGGMGTDIELAVLFSDVVGSTHIYEIMGDQRAREIVALCIDLMRGATEQNRGTVIKTMGDEVMATFPGADEALNAAAMIQRQISAHPALLVGGQPVSVRIGCHFGPVVLESRDVFGATVHTANRMTSQAKSGQIMTTAATVERLSPEWRASVRQIDIAMLKGQGAEVTLYEVLWQTEDVTSMLPSIASAGGYDRKTQRLRLVLSDREIVMDEKRPQIAIGRADDNEVVIRGNLISRIHARIEVNRNKFLLVDQSTNGTFVQAEDGEESFVRRDSMQLKGSGMIGLGRVPEAGNPQTIRFVCEEA
jgi:adenylate cyclase